MNLDELIKKIEKRPNMFFAIQDISRLKEYISGFIFSRSYQEDFHASEKHFKQEFSDFVATKLSKEKGNSWDTLLCDCDDAWKLFFNYYKEFSKQSSQESSPPE